MSTEQISNTILDIKTASSDILQETVLQVEDIQQLRTTMQNITTLANQSLESSQKITETTEDLSTQADLLQHAIKRFKLEA
jgi:methyl-accepting chemotaxis protein